MLPQNCPQCAAHYEAHAAALSFAFSNVGTSKGTSKEGVARAYFAGFHGRGHSGKLWDSLNRRPNDPVR